MRGPGALYGGVHLVLCVLAGLGAAAALRAAPRAHRPAASIALVAAAILATVWPRSVGLAPSVDYTIVELRPSDDSLELFDALERAGDSGPLLEVPLKRINLRKASEGLLLSAYHHRRTSYCYNSFYPAEIEEVERLSGELPDLDALARLREMGFRTLVVHHAAGELGAEMHRRRFEAFAEGAGRSALEMLHRNASLSAYRIVP